MKSLDVNRQKIIDLAENIINQKIHYIEGCRQLVWLGHDIGMQNDESFLEISGIDSQTDHIPIGKIRENCSVDFIKKIEKEEQLYKEDILKLCQEIIKKIKPEQGNETEKQGQHLKINF